QQGVPVANLVRQADVFSGNVPQETQAALELMFRDADYRKPVSKQQLSQALRYYASQAQQVKTGPSLDLGGSAVTPRDIIATARGRGTGDLMPDAAEM